MEFFPGSGHRDDPLSLNCRLNGAFIQGCNQLQGVFGLLNKYRVKFFAFHDVFIVQFNLNLYCSGK
jgi:hypothetical protein